MNPELVHQFFSFLHESFIGNLVFWLQFIAGILTSAFFAAIVVITFKYRQIFKPKIRVPKVAIPEKREKSDILGPWGEVQKKIESAYPSDWNLAVINADSVFDEILKDMGMQGVTLGDRLKQFDFSKLRSLNDVWEAHKIRNRIAHETDRAITHEEAKRAVSLFEKALKELEYLE